MKKTLETLYCPVCGCTKVQALAWLNANTHEFIKWEENDIELNTNWCPQCRDMVQAMNLIELWEQFSEVPINNNDEIEKDFLGFLAGTSRFDIWHWFDERCPNNLHDDLMYPSKQQQS